MWVSLKDPQLLRLGASDDSGRLGTGDRRRLLFGRRWAWVLGILTSVVLIEEGLRRVVFGPDRELIVLFSWTIHYFIPAIVILVCLLPGRARRAFLREGQSDAN